MAKRTDDGWQLVYTPKRFHRLTIEDVSIRISVIALNDEEHIFVQVQHPQDKNRIATLGPNEMTGFGSLPIKTK